MKLSWLFPILALATLDPTAQLRSFETSFLSWALGKVSQQYVIIPIIPVISDSLTAEAYIHTSYFSLYDFSGGWFTGYKCTFSYDYRRKKKRQVEWSATEIFHIKTKKSLVNKIVMLLPLRTANICKASNQLESIQLYFGFTLVEFYTLKSVEHKKVNTAGERQGCFSFSSEWLHHSLLTCWSWEDALSPAMQKGEQDELFHVVLVVEMPQLICSAGFDYRRWERSWSLTPGEWLNWGSSWRWNNQCQWQVKTLSSHSTTLIR